ncbi:hypothetical protein CHRY9393_03482 [Chryseobacterium fistulae]|uniref:Uncharacterized protein n=1 Tax=Chryseobacterium fistulae TaxID=2675058 RepID=A0A6N4XTC7_9FLAO|nr:hypothetical protein CHRY9393_03482 [Chryseobacterium fistulae]
MYLGSENEKKVVKMRGQILIYLIGSENERTNPNIPNR